MRGLAPLGINYPVAQDSRSRAVRDMLRKPPRIVQLLDKSGIAKIPMLEEVVDEKALAAGHAGQPIDHSLINS